jgi:hypothetical protein
MKEQTVSKVIAPDNHLALLSKSEMSILMDNSQGSLYQLMNNCALAVLNVGNVTDDGRELLERYSSFSINVIQEERGIKLKVKNAPASAFVDGKMIKGIKEHLFAVLRDIIYLKDEILDNPKINLTSTEGITDAVFHILRNARVVRPGTDPNLVVCWGGHSISRIEYDYTKKVGYQLGLRKLDICTGCGPGAMKGPMKGATIAHAKQRHNHGHYIGMTEPGIIAAEAPNPIVNDLVIMPDIEKRLEAFVRIGHGIIVFPGGAGTTEEILYILGILMNPDNHDAPYPLIFTGPESSADYFKQVDQFIGDTLGAEAQQYYQIIIGDSEEVAQLMKQGIAEVKDFRKQKDDAFYFNWRLRIDSEFQQPFLPTHENMANLSLHKNQKVHLLAANLRRVFSGIVAGNVKEEGLREIEAHGNYKISGDIEIMEPVDNLLKAFVEQKRMKLPGTEYVPCYEIVK